MRALRFRDIAEKKGINYSRMHIDRLEKAGQFPRRFSLGTNSVAWDEAEIDAWLKAKKDLRNEPRAA